MRISNSIAELRQQIRDDLRVQHPEWVEPNGGCPKCDSYESRLAELLESFTSNGIQRVYSCCSSPSRTGIKLNRHRSCRINQTCAASGEIYCSRFASAVKRSAPASWARINAHICARCYSLFGKESRLSIKLRLWAGNYATVQRFVSRDNAIC